MRGHSDVPIRRDVVGRLVVRANVDTAVDCIAVVEMMPEKSKGSQ